MPKQHLREAYEGRGTHVSALGKGWSTGPFYAPVELSALYAAAFSFFRRRANPQMPRAVPIGKVNGTARTDEMIASTLPHPWKFNRPIAAAMPSRA